MLTKGLVEIVRKKEVVFVAVFEDAHFNAQPEKGEFPGGIAIADFLRHEESRTALARHARRLKPKRRNDFEEEYYYWDWCEHWCSRNGIHRTDVLYSLLQLLKESRFEVEAPSKTRYRRVQDFYYTIDLSSKELHIKWCGAQRERQISYPFSEIPPNNELHIRLYNPEAGSQKSKLEQLKKFESAQKTCSELKPWLFDDGRIPRLLYPSSSNIERVLYQIE